MSSSSHDDPGAVREIMLAEYSALRAEILKRTEIQHQLIQLALIAPGTVVAIGVQTQQGLFVLLYPIFAFFLAAAWAANNRGVRQVAEYIRVRIERRLGHMRWENEMESVRKQRRVSSLNFFAARGIFIGTELLAIIVGLVLVPIEKQPLAQVAGVSIPDFGIAADVCITVAVIMVVGTLVALGRYPIVPLNP